MPPNFSPPLRGELFCSQHPQRDLLEPVTALAATHKSVRGRARKMEAGASPQCTHRAGAAHRLQTIALGLGGPINYVSPEEGELRDKNPGEEGRAWDGWKDKAMRK
jgi:hypothetical protein